MDCTLRAAIELANASSGFDTIEFALGIEAPNIKLNAFLGANADLPDITEAVFIDGDTGEAEFIQINAEEAANGLFITGGFSTADRLVIKRAGTGLGFVMVGTGIMLATNLVIGHWSLVIGRWSLVIGF